MGLAVPQDPAGFVQPIGVGVETEFPAPDGGVDDTYQVFERLPQGGIDIGGAVGFARGGLDAEFRGQCEGFEIEDIEKAFPTVSIPVFETEVEIVVATFLAGNLPVADRKREGSDTVLEIERQGGGGDEGSGCVDFQRSRIGETVLDNAFEALAINQGGEVVESAFLEGFHGFFFFGVLEGW